ncbi:MAG: choice-of-anchor X domain-containing protein [Nitrospirota bacterium]
MPRTPPSGAGEGGSTLIEVMLAMIILPFAILGVMGMFRWSDHGLQVGANSLRALALAESRLEAKRSVPWDLLLVDDLDSDGVPEVRMRDDGAGADAQAGDGIYTGETEVDGIQIVWTVQPDRVGPIACAGSAVIQARAAYPLGQGRRSELRIGTVRANPRYLGAT